MYYIQGVPKKIGILLNIASFFSRNTPKFFSCPVDAENGFKLDDWINMKEVMEKRQPKNPPFYWWKLIFLLILRMFNY